MIIACMQSTYYGCKPSSLIALPICEFIPTQSSYASQGTDQNKNPADIPVEFQPKCTWPRRSFGAAFLAQRADLI